MAGWLRTSPIRRPGSGAFQQLRQPPRELAFAQDLVDAGRARGLDDVLAGVIDIANHDKDSSLRRSLDGAHRLDRVERRAGEIDEQHVGFLLRDVVGDRRAAGQPCDLLASRGHVHLAGEHQVVDGCQDLHAHTPAPGSEPYGNPSTVALRPSSSASAEPGTISSLCTYPSITARSPTGVTDVSVPRFPCAGREGSRRAPGGGGFPATCSRTRFQATRPRKVAIATTSWPT